MHPLRGATIDRSATCAPLRRARRQCTPAPGASRCDACEKRSYERSDFFRGIPVWDSSFTVIELATGELHGLFSTETEAIARLVFAGLAFDEVAIVSDAPVTVRLTA